MTYIISLLCILDLRKKEISKHIKNPNYRGLNAGTNQAYRKG